MPRHKVLEECHFVSYSNNNSGLCGHLTLCNVKRAYIFGKCVLELAVLLFQSYTTQVHSLSKKVFSCFINHYLRKSYSSYTHFRKNKYLIMKHFFFKSQCAHQTRNIRPLKRIQWPVSTSSTPSMENVEIAVTACNMPSEEIVCIRIECNTLSTTL